MRAVAIGLALGDRRRADRVASAEASLFGISGNDLISYGAACFLLALTAGIAALIPARRASLVNPMEALRTE